MTGEQPQPTLFERGSNVHAYWLAHAEGFHVVSRRKPRDRVAHVVVDRRVGAATALVVQRKRGRRSKRIPVMWVSAVDPFERLLYLTPKRRAHTAVEHAMAGARSTWRAQQAAAVWLRPRAVEAVHATQRACLRAAHWLRPRLVELSERATVAYTRGYHASCDAVRTASAWLRPRVATLARRAVRTVRGSTSTMWLRAARVRARVRVAMLRVR